LHWVWPILISKIKRVPLHHLLLWTNNITKEGRFILCLLRSNLLLKKNPNTFLNGRD